MEHRSWGWVFSIPDEPAITLGTTTSRLLTILPALNAVYILIDMCRRVGDKNLFISTFAL
jgi:hypothetical protein